MKLKMKYLSILVICLSFITSGFICAKGTGSSDNSPLPDKRPDDLYFSYSQSGGMMYYSENIFLCKDSCYYKINEGGSISKAYFSMTADELDRLYAVFKENDFDEIGSYEEKVYDRGGETISLNWKPGKQVNVSNSGMTFVKDSWQKEWNACRSAIESIAGREIEKQKKEYTVMIDSSLFGKEFYLQVSLKIIIQPGVLKPENENDKVISKVIQLSPGIHRAIMDFKNRTYEIPVNTDSTKSLRLYVLNDSLRHEYIKK